MKKIVIKLFIFLIICIIFSIIYMFIPDKYFGGINKIQSILEQELVEKVVEKKIKEQFKDKKTLNVDIDDISSEIDKVINIDSDSVTNIKKDSKFDFSKVKTLVKE